MCGTFVRKNSSTGTRPFSSLTPAASSPRAPPLGRRPTQTSASSTSKSCPSDNRADHDAPWWDSISTVAPVTIFIPRFSKAPASTRTTAGSSPGNKLSVFSSKTTRAPSSWNRQANSHPTAPPPTTKRLLGTRGRDSARSESRMPSRKAGKGSGKKGSEPAATTALSKDISRPPARTACASLNLASPLTTVTLSFFKCCSREERRFPTMAVFFFWRSSQRTERDPST